MYSYSLENVGPDLDAAWTEKKNDLSKTVALNKGSIQSIIFLMDFTLFRTAT